MKEYFLELTEDQAAVVAGVLDDLAGGLHYYVNGDLEQFKKVVATAKSISNSLKSQGLVVRGAS